MNKLILPALAVFIIFVGVALADGNLTLKNNASVEISNVTFANVPLDTIANVTIQACAVNGNITTLVFSPLLLTPTITFSPTSPISNIINDTCANITLTVNGSAALGSYTTPVTFMTLAQTKNLTVYTNITSSSVNWTATKYGTYTFSAQPPIAAQLAESQTIINYGNQPLTFCVSFQNDNLSSKLVFDRDDFTLQPSTNKTIPIFYIASSGTIPSNYSATLVWSELTNHTSQNWTLQMNVPDTSFPEIINLSVLRTNVSYGDANTISTFVKDNVGLASVQLSVSNVIYNMTDSDTPNEWSYRITNLTHMGNNTWYVTACDPSGNCATQSATFIVSPLNWVNSTSPLAFGKWRFGTNATHPLFTTSSAIDLHVWLISFTFTPLYNETATVQAKILWNDQFGERLTDLTNNTQINLTHALGAASLLIRSNVRGSFTGVIELISPDFVYNPDRQIIFTGEFADFTAANGFEITLPNALGNMTCIPNVIDDYNASFMMCETKYPVDITPEELNLMLSKTSWDAAHKIEEMQRAQLENDNAGLRQWIYIIVIGIIVGAGFFGAWTFWQKYSASRLAMRAR